MNDSNWTPAIGEAVFFHPIIGERHDGRIYRVRATEDGHGGTRCRVWLEGKAGFVAVEALSLPPVEVEEVEEAAALPIRERLDQQIAEVRPGRTLVALHLSPAEYDELRADPDAAPLIELSSDGATYRGVHLGVSGGVDLPEPELPAEAVFTDDEGGEA